MKNRLLPFLVMGFFWAIASCATPSSSLKNLATEDPTATPTIEAQEPASSKSANLLTYDETANGIPVTAQYPADTMAVTSSGSGEGVGIFFTFKPQGNALDEAEIHIFLPSGAATAADQETFVTGSNGLIESNGWTVDSIQADGSEEFPYSWVETVINFSTGQEESGHILLGQTEGQAVQVTLKYPAEMADAYWSATKIVLESLTFDANLLPLNRSTEGE